MAKSTRKRPPGKPRATRRAGARAVPRGRTKGPQERALADVARVLAALDKPAAVIGGIAVITWGFARFTADIDCAVAAPVEALSQLIKAFAAGGIRPRVNDAAQFAKENLVLLLEHVETGVPVDVSLAQLAFEVTALESSVVRDFGDVRIPVPRLTDLVIYKLIAARPQDLQDVTELLALGQAVDGAVIATRLTEFDELLDTDRAAEWRRIQEKLR